MKRKNKKKEMKYLIQTTDSVNYIIDRTFLEMMLVSLWSPEKIASLGYATKNGWHVGNDNKIYETLDLNEKGDIYYRHTHVENKSEIPVATLQEMNNNPHIENFAGIKFRLKEFFHTNKISSILEYEGKELASKEQQTAKQQTPTLK